MTQQPTTAPAFREVRPLPLQLSPEQQQIVDHPDGFHGKVLSVAGSGKTTTMACRVRELVLNREVPPTAILALMYNRLARSQFRRRLEEVGLPQRLHPPVHTFHSFAYQFLENPDRREDWLTAPERAQYQLRRAIESVLQLRYPEPPNSSPSQRQARREGMAQLVTSIIEPAREAIMLWKNSNIPPERAGYEGSADSAELFRSIYQEFELRRAQARRAVTYDDFLPEALANYDQRMKTASPLAAPLRHLIIDEYQDINLAQQQLVERLAEKGADLMVVGDDDQTIYEWRGARTDYILGEFQNAFDNKPHRAYKLTHSFRFGYHIAQCAANVIRQNPNRINKDLLAYRPEVPGPVNLCRDSGELADRLQELLNSQQAQPGQIRILARSAAQLHRFAAELLLRGIPHQTAAAPGLLQSPEAGDLLNYLRLAAAARLPNPGEAEAELLRQIANKPNRFLSQEDRERIINHARQKRSCLLSAMVQIARPEGQPPRLAKHRNLEQLAQILEQADLGVIGQPAPAGQLLASLKDSSGLREHYRQLHGDSEATRQKQAVLDILADYAQRSGLAWPEFLNHAADADPSAGRPEADLVLLTTIHRAKGLEFDWVFLPECAEGLLPSLTPSGDPAFDLQDPRRTPQPAEWLENERRLFYVGITRARLGLFLSPSAQPEETPSRFLEELENEPTAAIAAELPKAAAGLDNNLAAVLESWHDQHGILRLIKQAYSRDFPEKERQAIAAVQLSRAEKPFGYSRPYGRPKTPTAREREQNWDRQLQNFLLNQVTQAADPET